MLLSEHLLLPILVSSIVEVGLPTNHPTNQEIQRRRGSLKIVDKRLNIAINMYIYTYSICIYILHVINQACIYAYA